MPDPPLCVQCHKRPVDPSWRPFCSARCKTIDLGRWLSGDYRIPGGPAVSDRVDDEDPEPVDRRGH